MPRHATPRLKAPAGSVGIAGRQTGVYPRDSPGGWRLIGRTPVALFNPHRVPAALVAPGDTVRFVRDRIRSDAVSGFSRTSDRLPALGHDARSITTSPRPFHHDPGRGPMGPSGERCARQAHGSPVASCGQRTRRQRSDGRVARSHANGS